MKPQRQPMPRIVKPEGQSMGDDPLAGDSILEQFYKPATEVPVHELGMPVKAAKEKPTHYKVVCISLYNQDIENLEQMVAELKRRGHTKANKSQLIRAALAQVDLAKIPKGF